MKSGFVNIFGKPNAGKSTLLNALMGEKLAIVSPKVQTTRHRIKAFLTKPGEYQIVFSDTPGIIEPKYKLHEKMMLHVKDALEDADLALVLADARDNAEENNLLFEQLKLKVPAIVVINKSDTISKERIGALENFFSDKSYCKKVISISALKKINTQKLLQAILDFLPEGEPFYSEEDLSDLPSRFFISEIIREKIFELFEEEIPYQCAVVVNEFKEKESIIKIQADIIVQRESQKAIILGEKGNMIKRVGIKAREDMEKFLESKVYLQLFVKVKPKWRDNEQQLKEYGY